jgi:hypothetical protein
MPLPLHEDVYFLPKIPYLYRYYKSHFSIYDENYLRSIPQLAVSLLINCNRQEIHELSDRNDVL